MNGVRPFTIMLKDMEVMKVDFETLQYEILNEKYLPYPVRGKLRRMWRCHSVYQLL